MAELSVRTEFAEVDLFVEADQSDLSGDGACCALKYSQTKLKLLRCLNDGDKK